MARGDRVVFAVETNERGQPQARSLKVLRQSPEEEIPWNLVEGGEAWPEEGPNSAPQGPNEVEAISQEGEFLTRACASDAEEVESKSSKCVSLEAEAQLLGLNEVFLSTIKRAVRQQEQIEKEVERMTDVSSKAYIEKMQVIARLGKVTGTYGELQAAQQRIEDAQLLAAAGDSEMQLLAQEEIDQWSQRKSELARRMLEALLPVDDRDKASTVIIEIRAGVGGAEAGLWTEDLKTMYEQMAEVEGMQCETVSADERDGGGFSEVSLSISGEDVWTKLKWESGVHRVQRVPATETMGRIHTSTATVALMPQLEESNYQLDMSQVEITYTRSGGKGGQNVNKVETACRVLHKPTGVFVKCSESRFRKFNEAYALRYLAAKLRQIEDEKRDSEIYVMRRSQIGSADRSEKIRTYNYKDNRVTDHRLKQNYALASFLAGGLADAHTGMRLLEQSEKFKELEQKLLNEMQK